ncbi:MAG: trypsin-like peptidase domain-containing protein [Candidatus Paceibacterota bacterium]|jgi:S1-C subfamily serine protease
MEYITKQQVILICILVAIVTSVATAISVVSLVDPSGSPTQTIYRVIETTIEKVADIPSDEPEVTRPIDIPKTPSVLSVSDIAQIGARSLVRIYSNVNNVRQFAALGVAVGSKDGVLATELLVPQATAYIAVLPDGSEVPAAFVKDDIAGTFSFFTLGYPVGTKSKVPVIELKNISGLKLGASVVAVGGKESGNVVSTGIVAELRPLDSDTSSASSTSNIVLTDMSLSSAYSGFLLFDTSGNLVAFERSVSEADDSPFFLNASILRGALAGLL